ncbi:Sema domain-containing protein [Meloidogyne graminicola]|uniref:Sema domain-containing protein n=1 Tax=Meloidogyne graminicola TaxID=189291 RepID=A0A8S9ZDK3_9BILA|nr:Sema domain-containing protein [Meloidogyne graminicola]
MLSSIQVDGFVEEQLTHQKQQDESIMAIFHDIHEGQEVELQRMVMDRSTGRLYVGAVNHLYDLSPEGLAIREHALTGPRADSVFCAAQMVGEKSRRLVTFFIYWNIGNALTICKEPLIPTDSHIKALAIYPDSNKLIECTSLYQGRCRTRNLSNIRRESDVRFSRPGIVPNDNHSSAQIFIGSGPSTVSSLPQPRVLYIGSTYVPVSLGQRDSLEVPAVSSISLENGRLFEFTEQSISSGTYMKLDYRRIPFFRIDYIGGFEANGFAYFATRQPKYTPQPDAQPTISKLVRVCTQDANFYSYTEAPLECEWAGQTYNLLQAIYLANAGFDLAASMRLKPTDLVLFGAFARGEGPERNLTMRDSALCAFSLRHIEAKFFENIRVCYNGNTRTNLPWFNSDKMCTATRYPDSEIMCGKDVNSYIGGEIPISSHALFVDKTSLFTSLAISSVQTATVAFIDTDMRYFVACRIIANFLFKILTINIPQVFNMPDLDKLIRMTKCTSDGFLHKALLQGEDGQSHIFKSIQVSDDGHSVLQDIELDEKNGFLYINIRLCTQSQDCHSCLKAGNPYCGWCLKPSACTTQEVCEADALNPRADWLNYKSGRCPAIRSVEPREQQITYSRPIHLRIENAPPALASHDGSTTSTLYCSFQFPNLLLVNVSAMSRDGDQVVCSTPTRSNLKTLVSETQTLNEVALNGLSSRLSIVQTADSAVLASTNFTFFDCHQLLSCQECASIRFPCDWCALSSRCVPNAEDICQGEPLRIGPSSRRGPEFCPSFSSPEGDLFVYSGHRRKVKVQASNLHEQMGAFKCQYTLIGQNSVTHEKLAQREGDEIICDEMLFEFGGSGDGNGTATALFGIVWATRSLTSSVFHPLDNSQRMRVIIYRCQQLANNCGLCLTLDVRKFECGWCENEGFCSPKTDCKGEWLSLDGNSVVSAPSTVVCPNPRIDDFQPRKGPINGGTKMTIFGSNLGLRFSDVRDNVRVASVKCDVSESDYLPSRKIVCYTRAPSTRQKQGQHVIVRLRDPRRDYSNNSTDDRKYTAISTQTFTYTNPQIATFQPYKGPKNGGTDLTIVILGTDLDSGVSFNISIGNSPCELRQRSASMVVCRTGPALSEKPEYLVLNADGTQLRVDSVHFQYTLVKLFSANPSIENVPKPVSTVSGGILIDVKGNGLDLLQRPRMLITFEGQNFWGGKCEVIDEHLMICRTPPLELSLDRRIHLNTQRPLRLDYGFDLDGSLTGNLTSSIDRTLHKLLVFPDPRLQPLPELLAVRPGGDLVLKGYNLNLAASARDVRVTVGGMPCNVTAIAVNTLTCVLPQHLDEGQRDEQMDVLVYIGDRIEKVGEASQHFRVSDPSQWLILTVAVAFLGVFLALMLFVFYRRKATCHNKQLHYLKAQMTSIEMRVAQECKEAFHELQTNMNALVGSMPQGASFIPFLPYTIYASRILFPQFSGTSPSSLHPILRELTVEQDRALQVESSLRQLHCLLQNRIFLLSFVRSIDANKYLLVKDRVYVGSLLMVVLQAQMNVLTDVLKQLLRDLIKRNVESKFQPKILFRRAESVAERMLSLWFAFLMYKHLRRSAGKPLYQLYWATKQQTEKGPQDAVTMDARYSLSEEKLLRASVDFRELTVFVLADSNSPVCDTQVRVLDCDSIGQERCLDAKYRTTPFSERPLPSEIDLELRTPTHRMVLQDLDGSSRFEAGGFWRYNTLAHYKVEDKATFALVPRNATSSSYNLSLISDKSEKSSGGSGGFSSHFHPHYTATNSPVFQKTSGGGGGSFFTSGSIGGHSIIGAERSAIDTLAAASSTMRVFHLVRPLNSNSTHGAEGQEQKMVTEIYLTRLLTMKGTLQKFIEDLLENIFLTTSSQSSLPHCIKYMFDFLDAQVKSQKFVISAREHGIVDPEVVHAWKSNSLPLRFWVNLIKNPDFIFDIQKPTRIEGSLNVVAQTLMDACSTHEQHLTKDSPSSKLLFANEMDKYRQWVRRFYIQVAETEPISDREMAMLLAEESQEHGQDFMIYSALNELFSYASQNKEMLFEELNQNEFALQQQLPAAFQKLLDTMDVPHDTQLLNGSMLSDTYADSKTRLVQPTHLGNNGNFY